MLSIAFSAILATSLGQLPPAPPADNPMDNVLNILRQEVPIYDKADIYGNRQAYPPGYGGAGYGAGAGYAGYDGGYPAGSNGYGNPAGYGAGYPAGYGGYPTSNTGGAACATGQGQGQTNIGGVGAFITGYAPKCNQGAYIRCLGTYIGPFPGGTACPGTTTQMGNCQQGGYCPIQPSYAQPSFPVQTGSGVLGRLEDEKEHKEINLRLEQLKLQLSKLIDTIREMEKRVETTEKASLSAEFKVKGLQEEIKQRWFLQDIESRLDQRIKPIEESLKQLSRRMEYLHKTRPDHPESPEAKKSGAKSFDESLLLSIDEKLDRLQLVMFDQLKKLGDQINEEKIHRVRIEDRIKNLEKGAAPGKEDMPPPPRKEEIKKEEIKKEEIKKEEIKKEDVKKEDVKKDDLKKDDLKKDDLKKDDLKKDIKGDTSNISKLKVARVSHVHGGVPGNKAVLIVDLPADAKLYLNGQPTKSVGAQRIFLTPDLEPGAVFVYNLRVEMTHQGELLTQTRTVPFRAGGQAHIVFEGPRIDVQTAGR